MKPNPTVVVAVIIALGAGLVIVGGDALFGDDDATSEPFPTATPTAQPTAESQSGGGSDATATATPTPPFTLTIQSVEQCGQTCRDVTSSLTNQQNETAESVTVYTRIFAGRGTSGDVVWRGEAAVGTLAPGETYTTTRTVDLTFSEALAVKNRDGWITIQTTVETADRTVTFTQQRQVA
ncbi:MAG: hypothetical protein ABEK02_04630 [Haloquadratum sp.]